MKLNIEPLVALVDEPVKICISELPADAKVRINCTLSLPWAKDVLFESSAWFTADSTGKVDLACQKPDSGSYNFADSMGLIVSMMPQNPGVAKLWVNEVFDVGLVVGKQLFVKLPAIESKHK